MSKSKSNNGKSNNGKSNNGKSNNGKNSIVSAINSKVILDSITKLIEGILQKTTPSCSL